MLVPMIHGWAAFAAVGLVVAIGGLFGVRRVAETMSKKITAMNAGQGLTANLVTSALVLAASPMGNTRVDTAMTAKLVARNNAIRFM